MISSHHLKLHLALYCVASPGILSAAPSLVPKTPNLAPDYYCTWNTQGYVCNYSSTDAQRRALDEGNLFGKGPNQNWISFFPKVREDLLFVMDDSWDVPPDGDKPWFGSLAPNEERFPSYRGTPAERLRKLTAAVKGAGWKGLGGWVCAQRAPRFADQGTEEAYWTERMSWMREAGFIYWKVDWGDKKADRDWRKMLTDLGKKAAPALVIEHAIARNTLDFAATFRTYDVENVISSPVTIDRIAGLLRDHPPESPTLVNCEDEPYIAAGLGCVVGVMRHPFAGALPNGRKDFVFPEAARDLKARLDEVTRAVRWHRIAQPVPLGASQAQLDSARLEDFWTLERDETWMAYSPGDRRAASAPARISRGLELPEVTVPQGSIAPFVLSTRSANGAIAIATIGRMQGRTYQTPAAKIVQAVGDSSGPFGVFGCFDELTLRFGKPLGEVRIFAQDLAGDQSTDITSRVKLDGDMLVLPREVLSVIGLSAASKGDKSEPGSVIVIRPK